MENEFVILKYSKKDFEDLRQIQLDSNLICNGQPDRYQYFQNQLIQKIGDFLLSPYFDYLKKERENKVLKFHDHVPLDE